jgi:hypothetical protein
LDGVIEEKKPSDWKSKRPQPSPLHHQNTTQPRLENNHDIQHHQAINTTLDYHERSSRRFRTAPFVGNRLANTSLNRQSERRHPWRCARSNLGRSKRLRWRGGGVNGGSRRRGCRDGGPAKEHSGEFKQETRALNLCFEGNWWWESGRLWTEELRVRDKGSS